MSNLGKLCFKKSGSALVYSKRTGSDRYKLVYKGNPAGVTTISFAWGSDGKDLDICAYWTNFPSKQFGYGHDTSTAEQRFGDNNEYYLQYSGDIKGTGGTEWVKINMSPWRSGETFKIHFNFYGYDAEDCPSSICTVIASQVGGGTFIKRDVSCSTSTGSAAQTSDPYVTINFDASGRLTGIS